jgi:RNA polymerase-binding protein DksA
VAAADEKGYVFINGRRVRMITTSGKLPPKRRATSAAAEVPAEETPKSPKPIKTNLTRKQLNYYRNLLRIKRAELVGDLSSLEAEALRSSGGNLSHMPIHMADIGSDTYEQDFMLGLAETERKFLREIDAALQRIEDGTYGICQMTGEPIPEARLEAKPWAMYTIEAARRLERGWSA